RPEEPDSRGQPGEEAVGVPEAPAPVEEALPAALPSRRSLLPLPQQPLRARQLDELVQFAFGQRLAKALRVGGADRLGGPRAVELRQQEVLRLAEVEELARARVLDHVLAPAAERPDQQLGPAGRQRRGKVWHGGPPPRHLAARPNRSPEEPAVVVPAG